MFIVQASEGGAARGVAGAGGRDSQQDLDKMLSSLGVQPVSGGLGGRCRLGVVHSTRWSL